MTDPTDRTDRTDAADSADPADPASVALSYQRLLDAALEETFPASDPIAPGAAAREDAVPVETARDAVDWELPPGSSAPTDRARPSRTPAPRRTS